MSSQHDRRHFYTLYVLDIMLRSADIAVDSLSSVCVVLLLILIRIVSVLIDPFNLS